MGFIVDIVIIAILALCIVLGYKRGLTGSLLKIISFVLALVITFILFKPVANLIVDHTDWDEGLEQSIRQVFLEEQNQENETTQANEQGQDEQKEDTSNQAMPDVIIDYLNEAIENAGTQAKDAAIEMAARDIAVTIIHIGTFIALFILSRILLLLVRGLANLITKLPVIKQFDKLGGIIYGLLQALVIIYVILAILSFISPMIAQTGIPQAVSESFIGGMFYNNNLLLKLVF